MDDLISRQAAIDALDFEIVHMTAYCDGKNEGNPLAQYNKGLEDGKKAIEALPPAQPEYEPVTAEDFAKTMSETSVYSYMLWHSEALTLMEGQGFVICKKTKRRCDLQTGGD